MEVSWCSVALWDLMMVNIRKLQVFWTRARSGLDYIMNVDTVLVNFYEKTQRVINLRLIFALWSILYSQNEISICFSVIQLHNAALQKQPQYTNRNSCNRIASFISSERDYRPHIFCVSITIIFFFFFIIFLVCLDYV